MSAHYLTRLKKQQLEEPQQKKRPTRKRARPQEWILDSGAVGHCTNSVDNLYNIETIPTVETICANGQTMLCSIEGKANADGKGLIAKNVLYLPDVLSNVLSVGCLTDDNHVVVFNKNECLIYRDRGFKSQGIVIATAQLAEDGLYKLTSTVPEENDPKTKKR